MNKLKFIGMSLLILIVLSISISAYDKTIIIPTTKKYYDLNMTNVSENYVPYAGATKDLELGTYNYYGANVDVDNEISAQSHITSGGTLTSQSLVVSAEGEPTISFINTEQYQDSGVWLRLKGNPTTTTQRTTGYIAGIQQDSWAGTDARNFNSYMAFGTLIDKVDAEGMRLNDVGLGIKNTDPQYPLDVTGTIHTDYLLTEGWIELTQPSYTSNGWIGMTHDVTGGADVGTYFGMQSNAGGDNIIDLYGNDETLLNYEYDLGTDGTDGNFKIGVGYALEGAFDRNDFVMNREGNIHMNNNVTINQTLTANNLELSGNLNISGALNVTGNITGNYIIGEMWNKLYAGFETVDLVTNNTYVQIKNLTAGDLNGFTTAGGNLTPLISGKYRISVVSSLQAVSVGGEYGMKVFINDTGVEDCYDTDDLGGTMGHMGINCFTNINTGDNINIRMDDHSNPVRDVIISYMNVNAERIGDAR